MDNLQVRFRILVLTGVGLSVLGCGGSGGGAVVAGKFTQTNLVADTAGAAAVTDPNLVNPWGISFSPNGPFWVNDNGTGKATVYTGAGATQGLVVNIPAAGGGANGPVSGQVYNATSDFVIPSSTAALFIFDNEDGVISAWNANSGSNAVTVVDRSASGTVYKGLAMGVSGGANFLFATNFNGNGVDVFDKNFAFVKTFTDPNIPAGFAPFGIANLGGQLYVSFAMQNAQKHDDVAGAGLGYIDVFGTDGTFVKRLVSQGALNSPWALVKAPPSFGSLGNALLVGNFGDGHINAYNISTGASFGALKSAGGTALAIDGLWGLTFGNGGSAGATGTLFFTAGPSGETHGLFGSLVPAP